MSNVAHGERNLNFEGVLRSPGCFFSHLGGVLGFLRGFVEVRGFFLYR